MRTCIAILLFPAFFLFSGSRLKDSSRIKAEPGFPKVAWGYIQRIPNFSSAWIGSRTIDVFVPEEYPAYPTKRYPVLYMHDGQMLFDSSLTWNHQEWGVDECLRDFYRKTGKTCMVVAIHNAGSGRYAEYFPAKPYWQLPASAKERIHELGRKDSNRQISDSLIASDSYLKFITRELKPLIDTVFRTKADPENCWIGGSSMGGLISLYAISEYPGVFGAGVCLSTHWPGIFTNKNNPIPDEFFRYLKNTFPEGLRHRLYLSSGGSGLDSLYRPHHANAVKLFAQKIRKTKDLKSVEIPAAGHSEKDWQQRLPEVFEFLMSGRN